MNIYIIKNNNNILGIYNNLDLGLDFIYSLINCNLIQKTSNIVIYEYKINTSIILHEYKIDLNYIISKQLNINYDKITQNNYINLNNNSEYESDSSIISSQTNTEIDEKNNNENSTEEEEKNKKKEREFINKQNILGQDKINVIHNINLLKEELKKNDEKINQYNYDLELYNKFKDLKNKNFNFIIPNMFENKYNIYCLLDSQNKLSYENFIKIYTPDKINTQYDEIFEDSIDSNSTISEIFYNAKESDLLFATNKN